jgi:two-component system, cell cycle response regulator
MARRILVVDDTATDRIALKSILSAARYQVRAVATARDAVSEIRAGEADIVICDAGLPDLAESGLAERMAAHAPSDPHFIILTRFDDAPTRARWLAAGVALILRRPVDKAWLLSNLRAILRARSARAENYRQVGTAMRLGFAEPPSSFALPRRVAVVGSSKAAVVRVTMGLRAGLDCPIVTPSPSETLDPPPNALPVDLHVIVHDSDPEEALWLLTELRANLATRHAAILLEFDDSDRTTGIQALDLGANALLRRDASAAERALLIRRELDAKIEADELRAQLDRSLALAAQDQLTGLYNRRYALHYLSDLSTGRRAEGRGYGVILIDVDRFKSVNDRLGHAGGDVVLRAVAQHLQANLRDHDLVARYGGEEFLVALADTTLEEAFVTAERLRGAVSARPIAVNGADCPITISAGIACSRSKDTETVIGAADTALYRAKANGRDRCELAAPRDFGSPHFGSFGMRRAAG